METKLDGGDYSMGSRGYQSFFIKEKVEIWRADELPSSYSRLYVDLALNCWSSVFAEILLSITLLHGT